MKKVLWSAAGIIMGVVIGLTIVYCIKGQRDNAMGKIIAEKYMEMLTEKEYLAFEGERAKEYGLTGMDYYVSSVDKKENGSYDIKVHIECHADKINTDYEYEDTERELLAMELTHWAEGNISVEDKKYGIIYGSSKDYNGFCIVNDKVSYSYDMLMAYERGYSEKVMDKNGNEIKCRHFGCDEPPLYEDFDIRYCKTHIEGFHYCRYPGCMNEIPNRKKAAWCHLHG